MKQEQYRDEEILKVRQEQELLAKLLAKKEKSHRQIQEIKEGSTIISEEEVFFERKSFFKDFISLRLPTNFLEKEAEGDAYIYNSPAHDIHIIISLFHKKAEELEVIELSYSIMPYVESLILFKEELLKKSNPYVNIKPRLKEEIEKLVLTYFSQYSYYFIQLARYALEDILRLTSFCEIAKTDTFHFIAGEYHDSGEIIDATKNTCESNEKALFHLEYVQEQRAYGLCQKGLKVQNKDYIWRRNYNYTS